MGSAAQATVIHSVENPGIYTTRVAGATTIDFNGGSCGTYAQCNVGSVIAGSAVVTGSASGQYASPYGITDAYLTVSHSSVTLALNDTYDYYGLYWGSVDTYNYLSFYLGDDLVHTFGGADLPPLVANGDQTADWSNRFVNFSFTDGARFDRVSGRQHRHRVRIRQPCVRENRFGAGAGHTGPARGRPAWESGSAAAWPADFDLPASRTLRLRVRLAR